MAHRNSSTELEEFERFSELAMLILVSLADHPKHGYAITEDIASYSGVRFGPGSLYGAVGLLQSRGLIEALTPSARRIPYRLTPLGARALRGRLRSLRTVVRLGQKRLSTHRRAHDANARPSPSPGLSP